MNRRKLLFSLGGLATAAILPTKSYSFLWNNGFRDDALWLSRATGVIKNQDLIVRSNCVLPRDLKILDSNITFIQKDSIFSFDHNIIENCLIKTNQKSYGPCLITYRPNDINITYV